MNNQKFIGKKCKELSFEMFYTETMDTSKKLFGLRNSWTFFLSEAIFAIGKLDFK